MIWSVFAYPSFNLISWELVSFHLLAILPFSYALIVNKNVQRNTAELWQLKAFEIISFLGQITLFSAES